MGPRQGFIDIAGRRCDQCGHWTDSCVCCPHCREYGCDICELLNEKEW